MSGAGESAGVDAAGVDAAGVAVALFFPLYSAPWYFSASEIQLVWDL